MFEHKKNMLNRSSCPDQVIISAGNDSCLPSFVCDEAEHHCGRFATTDYQNVFICFVLLFEKRKSEQRKREITTNKLESKCLIYLWKCRKKKYRFVASRDELVEKDFDHSSGVIVD